MGRRAGALRVAAERRLRRRGARGRGEPAGAAADHGGDGSAPRNPAVLSVARRVPGRLRAARRGSAEQAGTPHRTVIAGVPLPHGVQDQPFQHADGGVRRRLRRRRRQLPRGAARRLAQGEPLQAQHRGARPALGPGHRRPAAPPRPAGAGHQRAAGRPRPGALPAQAARRRRRRRRGGHLGRGAREPVLPAHRRRSRGRAHRAPGQRRAAVRRRGDPAVRHGPRPAGSRCGGLPRPVAQARAARRPGAPDRHPRPGPGRHLRQGPAGAAHRLGGRRRPARGAHGRGRRTVRRGRPRTQTPAAGPDQGVGGGGAPAPGPGGSPGAAHAGLRGHHAARAGGDR